MGKHGLRNGRAQKKPDMQSQELKAKQGSHVEVEKAQRNGDFALDSLSKLTQSVTSKNDSMAIVECPHLIRRMTTSPSMFEKMIGYD
ncbi:hypothetical protein Tco_0196745 [Tanacetum coccineum]